MQTFCFFVAALAGAFCFSAFLAKGSLSRRGVWISWIVGLLAVIAAILGFVAPAGVVLALAFAAIAIWKAPTT